jgi:hypothetical protein
MSAIREIQQAAADLYERSAISASKTANRFKVQRDIEDVIMRFRPDFIEAAEILDALRATLERRDMSEETREAIATYGKAFRDCLDRAYEVEPQ